MNREAFARKKNKTKAKLIFINRIRFDFDQHRPAHIRYRPQRQKRCRSRKCGFRPAPPDNTQPLFPTAHRRMFARMPLNPPKIFGSFLFVWFIFIQKKGNIPYFLMKKITQFIQAKPDKQSFSCSFLLPALLQILGSNCTNFHGMIFYSPGCLSSCQEVIAV
jgi:hypothetical protein